MNNEPVAWMFEKDGAYMCIKHDGRVNYDGGIPLYTHPAKTLTDEEIPTWQERCEAHPDHQSGMITHQMIKNRMQEEIDALRAILRKAQE